MIHAFVNFPRSLLKGKQSTTYFKHNSYKQFYNYVHFFKKLYNGNLSLTVFKIAMVHKITILQWSVRSHKKVEIVLKRSALTNMYNI
jgi:hypothetical protein